MISALRVLNRTYPRAIRHLCDVAPSSLPITSRDYEYINATSDDRIGVVELHRPRELNIMTESLLTEVADAISGFDEDPSIHVIILTGSDRVFAAGNDVEELASRNYRSIRYKRDPNQPIDLISSTKKPIIAAVSGFALGGGCELAMASDIVIASEDATFGQPEVQLGTIPSAGGTQRLVRAVGKAKAMEMILTGRQMSAEEAESAGLVTRVTPKGKALDEAKDVAAIIAKHSTPIVENAKECVNIAFESTLSQGLIFERRAFQSTFALDDRQEGMKAFLDKRKPSFHNR